MSRQASGRSPLCLNASRACVEVGLANRDMPGSALDCFICTDKDGSYCLPKAYQHSMPNILFGNPAEELTKNIIAAHVRSGSVFHAGAYVGDFFPFLEKILDDGHVCISCEPVPLTYKAAEITQLVSGLKKIRCSQVALGSEAGEIEIQAQDETGLPLAQTARFMPNRPAGTGVSVKMETIDQLCYGTDIKVLHLDLEGYEFWAMAGAVDVLRRDDILVVIENYQEKIVKEYLSDFTCFAETDHNYFFSRKPIIKDPFSKLAAARLISQRGDQTTGDAQIATLYGKYPQEPLIIEAYIALLQRSGDHSTASQLALQLMEREPWRLSCYSAIEAARRAGFAVPGVLDVLRHGLVQTGHPNCAYQYVSAGIATTLDADEAQAITSRFLEAFPLHAEIALCDSKVRELRGDIVGAIASMEHALRLRPDRNVFKARLDQLTAGVPQIAITGRG